MAQQGSGWFVPVDRKVTERTQISLSGWMTGQIPYFARVSVYLCCKIAVTAEPPGLVRRPDDSAIVKSPLYVLGKACSKEKKNGGMPEC